jgi:hypothetical protein
VRAKVRWLLADKADGTDDTGLVMLNGLAHSRNLQLQKQLLQAAWDDTERVPTDVLQSALQQTKAFLQNKTFELYYSHGAPGRTMPHADVVAEYSRELGEVVATLPQRTGSNREQTVSYLVMSGCGVLSPIDASSLRAAVQQEFARSGPQVESSQLWMNWKERCESPSLVTKAN